MHAPIGDYLQITVRHYSIASVRSFNLLFKIASVQTEN